MSEERKPRLWPWIIAVLIGLPVVYVAEFGPVMFYSTCFGCSCS